MRSLSPLQAPAEDKLQIKNIIFHTVKNALAVLREHKKDDGSSSNGIVAQVTAPRNGNNPDDTVVKKEGAADKAEKK